MMFWYRLNQISLLGDKTYNSVVKSLNSGLAMNFPIYIMKLFVLVEAAGCKASNGPLNVSLTIFAVPFTGTQVRQSK